MVYGRYNELVNGVNLNQLITEGHHIVSPFVCFFWAGKIHSISLGFTCLDQPRLSSKGQADPGLGFSMSSLRYSKCSPDFPVTFSGYKPSFLEDVQ